MTRGRDVGRRARGAAPALARHLRRLRGGAHVLHQVQAAGAHPHGTAQHDAGGGGGEGVDVAVQGGRHQERGRRLKGDLQEGRGAGVDADAVARAVAALRVRGQGRARRPYEGGVAVRVLTGPFPRGRNGCAWLAAGALGAGHAGGL